MHSFYEKLSRRKRLLPQHATILNLMLLPRREGYMSGLAIMGVFAISLRVQNNMLLLLAVGVGVLFLVSLFWSGHNIAGIAVELEPGQRLIAGIEQKVRLTIRAPSPRYHLFLLMAGGRENLDLKKGVLRINHKVRLENRGWQHLPSLRIESDYPFGIARSWCSLTPGQILVAPRPLYGYRRMFQDIRIRQPSDPHLADTIDDWRPGMPLSRIHWKRYAGTRRLFTKSTEDTATSPLEIDYDAVRHLGHEKALSIMSATVLDAMLNQQAFLITLPGKQLNIAAGFGGEALDALAMA